MELPSGRRYPISRNGLIHLPRSWIMGGPDSYSLCETINDVWGQKWGTEGGGARGCMICVARIQKRIDWYEEFVRELGP